MKNLCFVPNFLKTNSMSTTCQNHQSSNPTYTNDLTHLDYKDFSKFLPLEDGDKAIVIKVYDGDTLTVGFRHGSSSRPVRESVRIRGIDTPELRTNSEKEKELAILARSRLEEATLREVVTLVSPESDKYGRLLCAVKTEKIKSIAAYMLEANHICRKYDGGKRKAWP